MVKDLDAIPCPRHQMGKAVVDAEHLVAAIARFQGNGADGAVDSRRGAAANQDTDASAITR